MRITSKGRVTIPKKIRDRYGLLPGTEVEFIAGTNSVRIVKSPKPAKDTRGQMIVRRLQRQASIKMSTDEILALTRR